MYQGDEQHKRFHQLFHKDREHTSELQRTAETMSKEDKLCVLLFDEISLKAQLTFHERKDKITGFVDNSCERKPEFADHAQVFMIRGLVKNYKQAISYGFSRSAMKGPELASQIKMIEHMNDKPYFEFEGEEIITFPHPPHLLKCFRNLFMTYDVKLLSFASWKHIEQFIELDNSNPHFVFAPKHHIQPNGKEKMRVKLAAQIFSHSVAMGIYSKASTNDIMIVFLNKSVHLINELQFIGCKRKPPSQGGWLKLLNGYERLSDSLYKKHQIKSIATRRINQDPLENCFGCIRANCGLNDNPTVAQFIAGLKTGIITNMRNIIKNKKYCEEDSGKFPISHDVICVSDEEIESSAETQACAYVCGFIFKKYAKDCGNCKKAMLAEKPTEIHQFTQFKEYVDGKHSLNYANHSFIACVEKSAELDQSYLKENSHLDQIKKMQHWLANKNMIEQSVSIFLIKRFCLLQNRRFSVESAKNSTLPSNNNEIAIDSPESQLTQSWVLELEIQHLSKIHA
ncbi:hypothetical protein ABMA27_008965 [Loxostege sticticalis]|uniref:Transposable element P transposase n=1 Tax=Loxostege sticticalis TaxID=481309 RepID=A0ABR3H9N2_LOXSC